MLKRIAGTIVVGVGILTVPGTAAATDFGAVCSPGGFKVCAGADLTWSGADLVLKVWNLNLGGGADPYATDTGGYHTITAVGLIHDPSVSATGFKTEYFQFNDTDATLVTKWEEGATKLQVDVGSSTEKGHDGGIVGCFDPPHGSKTTHYSTCSTGSFQPYMKFTFFNVSPNAPVDGFTFEFHGQQAMYSSVDACKTEEAKKTGGNVAACDNTSSETYLYGASYKGTGVPPTSTVPEPFSMALLGTGLLGLGAARRKRRQATDE